VAVVHVKSAHQMLAVLTEHYPRLDALIMAAAVADFKVQAMAEQKIKRGEHALELSLVPNQDLLAATAALGGDARPIRVGFAAETQDLVEHAVDKLARKSLDLIVANDVSAGVFGAETNQVTLLWSDGRREDLPKMAKTDVAERVLDAVVALFPRKPS
jgi:phosphopantothenoylcysteine decarboxylase/phosphopantothenate--cysteine ligase